MACRTWRRRSCCCTRRTCAGRRTMRTSRRRCRSCRTRLGSGSAMQLPSGSPPVPGTPASRADRRTVPFMAYDEDLADRIRAALGKQPVAEKKMFGGLAFLVGGNMAVAASGQGGLMVRVAPDETAALLNEPGAEEFEMRGRAMQGWLRVQGAVLEKDDVLRAWVERGVAYARSLPTK